MLFPFEVISQELPGVAGVAWRFKQWERAKLNERRIDALELVTAKLRRLYQELLTWFKLFIGIY